MNTGIETTASVKSADEGECEPLPYDVIVN